MSSFSNKKALILIVSIIILIQFNFFRLSPLAIPISYLLFLISSLGFLIFIFKQKLFNREIKFWFCIGIASMVISILTCTAYYGQSFISGIIANQGFYKIGSVIFIYYLIRIYKISFESLLDSLVTVGWFIAIAILIMSIFDFEVSVVSELTGKTTVFHSGTLSKAFTNFIAILYLNFYLTKQKTKYLLFSIFFFGLNHIYSFQRLSFMISLAIILLALTIKGSVYKNIKFLILLLGLGLIALFFTDIAYLYKTILNAFKILTPDTVTDTMDSSIIERVNEAYFALERINEHPIFGNGYYRASEAEKVLGPGVYFYESDIGVIGILYSLGVFGLSVFLLQGIFIKKLLRWASNEKFGVVLNLCFIWFYTIGTGQSISQYHIYFLHIILLSIWVKKSLEYEA